MPAYKIYISSTYRDLIEDRALLRLKLDQAQYTTVCMETYPPALSQVIKTKCENDVKDCDLYVCIIGDRYGSLAQDETGRELEHSYTEYEYDAAVASNKKRLIFIKDLGKEPDDPRLLAFIQKIRKSAFLTASFKEIHQLPTDVLVSIVAETGENKKRLFSPDLKYFCDRAEHTNAFDTIFFQQKASAKIHFFLLPGHMYNGHRAFIERYKCRFKSINNGEEPIEINFNIKTDGVADEAKIKELIKQFIRRGISDRFKIEQLDDVKANTLFEQLARVNKKILFVIMNVQSTYIKENFAEMYKASIEKFYHEFTGADDPAYQDRRIIFFLNLQYVDNPKNLDVLNRTFNDNPFFADKKLPGLDNITADDIMEWLEFHNIEKTPMQATRVIQKQITKIEDADYEELSDAGIYMDEATQLMEAIIDQYNQKTT